MATEKRKAEEPFWPLVIIILFYTVVHGSIPADEPWHSIYTGLSYGAGLLLIGIFALKRRGEKGLGIAVYSLVLFVLALPSMLSTIVDYRIIFADSMYEEWFPDYYSQSHDEMEINFGEEAVSLLMAVKPGDRVCLEGDKETFYFSVELAESDRSVVLEFHSPFLYDMKGWELARIIAGDNDGYNFPAIQSIVGVFISWSVERRSGGEWRVVYTQDAQEALP